VTARDLLTGVSGIDACAVSDALDSLGVRAQVADRIRAMWPVGDTVVVGRVRTVQAGPRSSRAPAAHIAAATVAEASEGDVIVVANEGREDVSCWGGILTEAAVGQGVLGVVVDGACRDIAESQEARFPVFARRTTPTSARGRIVQLDAGAPVEIAGVTVHEGDLVVADATGVVFVPQDLAAQVAELAARIVSRENQMRDRVRAGSSVVEVMHDSAFPTLARTEGSDDA